jgi:hypothetical protein
LGEAIDRVGERIVGTSSRQRSAARGKAEEVIARRDQKEAERLANRAKERQAEDEKTARLRRLRLAKEAADEEAVADAARRRRTAKTHD